MGLRLSNKYLKMQSLNKLKAIFYLMLLLNFNCSKNKAQNKCINCIDDCYRTILLAKIHSFYDGNFGELLNITPTEGYFPPFLLEEKYQLAHSYNSIEWLKTIERKGGIRFLFKKSYMWIIVYF